jgi:NAD-dependent dihydropyrimidine dehydrogenase PreA subunit
MEGPTPTPPARVAFRIGDPADGRYVRLLVNQCCGCGDCQELCPVDAITMNGAHLPCIDGDECIGCGICYQWCPESAIVMPDGWHRCD